MKQVPYGFGRDFDFSYEQALEKVPAALTAQGFGVLTEIDVKATLKKKLDVDFRKYKILGACRPPSAYQALSAELGIGLLLPCNVVVYENDAGTATVLAIDPVAAMGTADNPALAEVAREVKSRLEAVLASLP